MPRINQRELGYIEELLRLEQSLYEKFHHFAQHADEQATQRLCKQLGDRSREHLAALVGTLEQPEARIH